jgi:hypothetical protein
MYDKFPKYHMKNLLGDFNAIFKQLGMRVYMKLVMILELE